jgi:hypothetical protein
MSLKQIFSGQAVKSEMVVLILEKWDLHPEFREATAASDTNDLDRDTFVLIPDEEYDRAHEILWGESEIERAGF